MTIVGDNEEGWIPDYEGKEDNVGDDKCLVGNEGNCRDDGDGCGEFRCDVGGQYRTPTLRPPSPQVFGGDPSERKRR